MSAGQSRLSPVQSSASSQSPAAARHSTPAGFTPSGGQLALDPLQVSAASQAPAIGRQTVPSLPGRCRHVAEVSHTSRVQKLPSSRHCVPAGSGAPPVQAPSRQVSPAVQPLPSSHAVPSVSSPPPQKPSRQVSPVVHGLSSSQLDSSGTRKPAQHPA